MGTNYYWHPNPPCKECGRAFEPHHIGKSSGGWCFALHVIPGEINSLEQWQVLWNKPTSEIKDEYGQSVPPEVMRGIVTGRSWKSTIQRTEKEYADNHAEPGPNGLIRSKIDGSHCIGHGEGTWDLITGEFS